MADSTKLFVFIVLFWGLLTTFSYVFEEQIGYPVLDETELFMQDTDTQVLKNADNWLDNTVKYFIDGIEKTIPFADLFTPILRLLTFQYVPEVPALIVYLLDVIAIFSLYVLINVIVPTK